ncbi:MAG: hypothetical protein LBI28_00960 [Treponema sp.]|jgi:hypothetical protein|nr:hypothetical protein [Treponema sp.]
MNNFYRLPALCLLLLIAGFSVQLFAYEDSPGEVEFNIRFFDRRIYYVESDSINVQITITNNSPAPYRFKLADDRAFSVDFDIRTMTNRLLPAADSLTRKRTVNSHVFFREVTIETGESFSFMEDLRDYVSFSQPGSFRVRARVYPELIRSNATPAIESNYLTLNIRPAVVRGPDNIPLEMDVATGAVLVRQRIPPDEVVTYMLTARQQSQWERYFLYLDPQQLLIRDPVLRNRYNAENEAGRRRMVAEYRQNMQNSVIDGDIVTIPTTFNILNTQYNNFEGTVTVMQRYRMPNFTELRLYTYFLEKNDNFWMIVNYAVQGMGTEANN